METKRTTIDDIRFKEGHRCFALSSEEVLLIRNEASQLSRKTLEIIPETLEFLVRPKLLGRTDGFVGMLSGSDLRAMSKVLRTAELMSKDLDTKRRLCELDNKVRGVMAQISTDVFIEDKLEELTTKLEKISRWVLGKPFTKDVPKRSVKRFVEYRVTVSALVPVDADEQATPEDIIRRVAAGQVLEAQIHPPSDDELQAAWETGDATVYVSDEDGTCAWRELEEKK